MRACEGSGSDRQCGLGEKGPTSELRGNGIEGGSLSLKSEWLRRSEYVRC